MRLITIENKYGKLTAHEERRAGSRREFVVTGELEISLIGSFSQTEYECAANLAMNIAEGMNIRPSQVARVSRELAKRYVKRHKNSRTMF